MKKYFFVMLIFIPFLITSAAEHQGVSELLSKYHKAQQNMRSFIGWSECSDDDISTDSDPEFKFTQCEFGTDSNRVDIFLQEWRSLKRIEFPLEKDNFSIHQFIWDGEKKIDYMRGGSDLGRAFIVNNDTSNAKIHTIAVGYPGAPLMGIFCGDDLPVDRILKDSNSIIVRDEMEKVGDSLTYVIDAETTHGKYTIWLDPEHGFNISKAKVIKNENDIAWNGKALNWQNPNPPPSCASVKIVHRVSTRLTFSMENVRFDKIGDTWVPVSADYQSTFEYDHNNVRNTTKKHFTMSRVVINPDFEAAGTFKPKIKNGATIYVEGEKFAYRWFGGIYIPKVD